jgi:hypothetical protein
MPREATFQGLSGLEDCDLSFTTIGANDVVTVTRYSDRHNNGKYRDGDHQLDQRESVLSAAGRFPHGHNSKTLIIEFAARLVGLRKSSPEA